MPPSLGALLYESGATVFGNLKLFVWLAILPLIFSAVVPALLGLTGGVAPVDPALLAPPDPENPQVAAEQLRGLLGLLAAIILNLLLFLIIVAPFASAWIRIGVFGLTEASGQGLDYRFDGPARRVALLSVMVAVVALAIFLVIGSLVATVFFLLLGEIGALLGTIVGALVAGVVLSRSAMLVAARAVGRNDMVMAQAWRLAHGLEWRMLLAGITIMVLFYLPTVLLTVIAEGASALLSGSFAKALFIGLVVQLPSFFAAAIMGVILGQLYRHAVGATGGANPAS